LGGKRVFGALVCCARRNRSAAGDGAMKKMALILATFVLIRFLPR
jgi:hypothetical protein